MDQELQTCESTKTDLIKCLIKHLRVHSGEKPYKCEFCELTFSQISNLIRHRRVHNGNRPYVCNQCNKRFTSSSNLKIHKNIHKNLKKRDRHICLINECDKTYLYLCTLKKHMEIIHKNEMNTINSYFGNIPFNLMFKNLLNDPSKFKFIKVKNIEDYLPDNSYKIENLADFTISHNFNLKYINDNLKVETIENFNISNKNESSTNHNSDNINNNSFNCCNFQNVNQQLLTLTNSLYSYQLNQIRNQILMQTLLMNNSLNFS